MCLCQLVTFLPNGNPQTSLQYTSWGIKAQSPTTVPSLSCLFLLNYWNALFISDSYAISSQTPFSPQNSSDSGLAAQSRRHSYLLLTTGRGTWTLIRLSSAALLSNAYSHDQFLSQCSCYSLPVRSGVPQGSILRLHRFDTYACILQFVQKSK